MWPTNAESIEPMPSRQANETSIGHPMLAIATTSARRLKYGRPPRSGSPDGFVLSIARVARPQACEWMAMLLHTGEHTRGKPRKVTRFYPPTPVRAHLS